jgi:molybdopterin-binding protein
VVYYQVGFPNQEADVTLSARNHLPGIVEEIERDAIIAHVVVKVGDHRVEAIITRRSADELGLKVGDSVTTVVKATEVMIAKP